MKLAPESIAHDLDAAAAERQPLTPFTDEHPDLGLEIAYDVQRRVVSRRVGRGERVVGVKLGLTSRAKQLAMNVDEPLYGRLTDAMALAPGMPLALDRFIHPRAEPEIGFLLGRELRGPVGSIEVLDATVAVFGAVEVIDSRYADFRFRLPDVVADNASAAAYVAGPLALPPSQLGDLGLVGCVLRQDGEVVATAAGAAVLGHPAAAVAWLVNRLATHGEALPARALVLSGALTDAVALRPGTTVEACFDGLGAVELAT